MIQPRATEALHRGQDWLPHLPHNRRLGLSRNLRHVGEGASDGRCDKITLDEIERIRIRPLTRTGCVHCLQRRDDPDTIWFQVHFLYGPTIATERQK
jgi:hypothetical protein